MAAVENYILANDLWKNDIMPEFYNGKNVADFVDPEIEAKLEALEREEDALEADGFYASDDEEMASPPFGFCHITDREQPDSDEEEFRDAAQQVNKKKAVIKKMSQEKNKLQNRPIIPRKKKHVSLSEFTHGMRQHGHDPSVLEKRAARLVEQKKAAYDEAVAREPEADVEMADVSSKPVKGGRAADRTPRGNRQFAGMATSAQADKAVELRNFAQREPNRLAKASESDRHVPITRPKWMLAGKRKGGKTQRR